MAEQVQQVTTKDPKEVEQSKRLTEWDRKITKKLGQEAKAQNSESETNLTYYAAGVVVAIGVLGVIGYYVYQSRTLVNQCKKAPVYQLKETPDKFNME